MSLIRLGFWAASGAGGVSYWIATFGGSGNDTGMSIATDSSGNSYAAGYTASEGAGSDDLSISKYNAAGIIQWQRILGGASLDRANGVSVDSSSNVYAVGRTASTGGGGTDFLITKYNSSGTLQWQQSLGGTGNEIANDVSIDSAGNIYVLGKTIASGGAGGNQLFLAKYNSSGTLQWQRTLEGAVTDTGESVAIDSADNVYAVGGTDSEGAGGIDLLLAKYNSSGTLQWQRTLGGSSTDAGYGIAIDSSDNVYCVGDTLSQGAGSDDFLIAKYNSSGTLQWQRLLGGSDSDEGTSIAIDSADNLYALGRSGAYPSWDFCIAKYNSAGTIQWQRTLGGPGIDLGKGITLDSNDNLFVIGEATSIGEGGREFLLAKIPSDGSLTGTYVLDGVNVIYAASSLTAATSTLTSSTSTLTAVTSTLTSATSTLTAATSTLTSHLVEIPA
jgi:uncharacterized delta-60 repeat protein